MNNDIDAAGVLAIVAGVIAIVWLILEQIGRAR